MPTLFAIWICSCVYLNCIGWLLALLHQLNPVGYVLALMPAALGWLAWLKKNPPVFCRSRLARRFIQPLPAIYLLLTALIFLGGMLYAPNNFDALTYRLPRMLNWLLSGQCFWISTINERMNYSGVAWEWIAMPILTLTRSDRWLFLINALGFLLLPGLLFSIFRQLGVARKVAWTWMWLLPLAYGYATQAGGIGNDLVGTLFCLLSVYFGFRARHSGKSSDLWLALLAAALMTGVKLSNLPLALPCVVAAWPALRVLWQNRIGSLVVMFAAVVVSALPIMAFNQSHTGSWNGDPHNKYEMQLHHPVAGLLGNGFLVAEMSLFPPVLPVSNKIHQRLTDTLPDFLHQQFPRLFMAKMNEIPGEEGAGLNLTITLPLLVVLIVSAGHFRSWFSLKNVGSLCPPVALATWVAGLVFMAKLGSEAGPRLLLPYYPLALMPLLLLPAQSILLRHRTWMVFMALMALGTLPVLLASIARPLWPAQTVSVWLASHHPENNTLKRLATTYTAYAHRNDILAPIRSALPADVREIGFVAGSNDTSYSLWRPFGDRRVYDLRPEGQKFVEHPQPGWVVIKQDAWSEISSDSIQKWAAEHRAQIVLKVPIVELVSAGAQTWYLLHIETADHP